MARGMCNAVHRYIDRIPHSRSKSEEVMSSLVLLEMLLCSKFAPRQAGLLATVKTKHKWVAGLTDAMTLQ